MALSNQTLALLEVKKDVSVVARKDVQANTGLREVCSVASLVRTSMYMYMLHVELTGRRGEL